MIASILAVTFGIVVYSLIVLKFNSYGTFKDSIKKRLSSISNTGYKGVPLDEELSKPLFDRFLKPLFLGFIKRIKKYIPEEQKENVGGKNNKLKKLLRQADIKMGINEYRWLRLSVMIGSSLVIGVVSLVLKMEIFIVILSALFGVLTPYIVLRFHLSMRVSKRCNSMQKQLPEVLDMLSVSVEAGLGLEQAMVYVVNNFEGPLINEIAVSNREMSMGRSRKEALLLLGDRCEIEEMKTFVRAIIQAAQLGISIKNVLRSQSSFMRQSRRNKIEEKAMQISVKILIPMVLFIFPVIFIVLLGPAVVDIVDQFL